MKLELPPDFNSPKSRLPFLIMLLIADASVLEKFALYGPAVSDVKSTWLGYTLNYSSKLDDCFGLNVLPRPYFSPDGDLGGVSPFYVGECGYFCIFVINSGDGGAVSVYPGVPDSISCSNFFIS